MTASLSFKYLNVTRRGRSLSDDQRSNLNIFSMLFSSSLILKTPSSKSVTKTSFQEFDEILHFSAYSSNLSPLQSSYSVPPALQKLASVTVVNTARDLGVSLDSQLSLDAHVASVCRSSYYQLKQLRPVARSLSVEAAKTLVQAFVSSRLDCCNAILHDLPEKLMRCLQSVQNAAARMIASAQRRDHITPIVRQLHWLPVRQRVDFKIAVLVFQCLTGHAPSYLADDCQLAADASARRLRSADTAIKYVVRRMYNNFGDRCFAAAGPRLWNTLLLNLRLCDSLGQFKWSLKTFLFGL